MATENFIDFNNVTFAYPAVEGDLDSDGKQIIPAPVFEHFTAQLPGGFTSLIGPNGSGKSTFLMLASGRLVPQEGSIHLFGKQIPLLNEEQKNLLASVIYQNMEFETEEKVEQLLKFVYENGSLKAKASAIKNGGDLYDEVVSVFELKNVMNHGLTKLSKGEIQRTLLAFSLLYGSKSIFMDEPLFAMEEPQKNSSLEYLRLFCEKTSVPVYISMHELDLSRRYAQNVMLFFPNRDITFGSPDEILVDEDLEKAYGFPASMLKNKEDMTREQLLQISDALK
ncbi:MAG: ATP-binding cassette domain-containing protein [Treponema sp.]|nr:ATP-binding cassette domain-containing protein [Treponema sp.]